MIESTAYAYRTLRFDDVMMCQAGAGRLPPLLREVQRSRMRSRERSGRRPGNEATECEQVMMSPDYQYHKQDRLF